MNIRFAGILLLVVGASAFIVTSPSLDREEIVLQEDYRLCDPNSGAFIIPGSIALPSAKDISSGSNRDSSLIVFLQNAADSFSWKTFIAINWAANKDGMVDSTICFGSKNTTTVWQSWMPSTKIYVGNNATPAPWDESAKSYSLNRANLSKDTSVSDLEADDHPLIAQNKMYTLFEVFYNKSAYDYVVQSKLYNKNGQQDFVKNYPSFTKGLTVMIGNDTMNIGKRFQRAYFSVGNVKDSTEKHHDTTFLFTTGQGAMIIKTAWLPLTEKDDPKRFFTRTINTRFNKTLKVRVYGLVGMHIMHKVAEETQWVWSSFEHIDAAPLLDSSGTPMVDPSVNYLYFNKSNRDKSTINKPPPSSYEPIVFKRSPTQVARVLNIEASTQLINKYYQKLVREAAPKSIWANYQLVGTQWAFDPDLFTQGRSYQPRHLANTVLETYIQGTSSCMGCHSKARFLADPKTNSYGYNADFVWGLTDMK